MKVEITGNDKTPIERIPRDAIKPTKEGFKRYIRWQGEMELQNACIDIMEAGSREEILKIWSEMDRWYDGFAPIQFWPNMESWEKYNATGLESGEIRLEIIPENKDDIRAMNQCLYNVLREIAYNENHHMKLVDTKLIKWAKELRNEIVQGYRITPLKSEYIQTYLNHIEKKVGIFELNKYRYGSSKTFKTLIDEERETLIMGKDLISTMKLIKQLPRIRQIPTSNDEDHSETPYLFMHRIIAHDIAQIILDLESGKFIPDTSDMEVPAKKSRSTTDISFKWLSNSDSELPPLFDNMINAELITPETTIEQFTAIFSGKAMECIKPVEWVETTVLLAYFIDQLKHFRKISSNRDCWAIGAISFTHATNKITRNTLKSSSYKYKGNDGNFGMPIGYEMIDELF